MPQKRTPAACQQPFLRRAADAMLIALRVALSSLPLRVLSALPPSPLACAGRPCATQFAAMLRMQNASSDATVAARCRAMRVRKKALSGSLYDACCPSAQWLLRLFVIAVRVCCLRRLRCVSTTWTVSFLHPPSAGRRDGSALSGGLNVGIGIRSLRSRLLRCAGCAGACRCRVHASWGLLRLVRWRCCVGMRGVGLPWLLAAVSASRARNARDVAVA